MATVTLKQEDWTLVLSALRSSDLLTAPTGRLADRLAQIIAKIEVETNQ